MRYFYGYLYLAKTDLITKRQASEVSGIMYLPFEDIIKLKDSTTHDSVVALLEIIKRAKEKKIL